MKSSLLSILFLALITFVCKGQETPKDFDYGHVENDKYVNSFFNFEITLPINWIVQSKEQRDNLMKTGEELLAGEDKKMKAVVKAAEIKSANLLTVFQYERGSAVEYNPGMLIIVENVSNLPGMKTGSDYLFQARKFMVQSQFKYDTIDKDFAKEVINGVEFYKMNAALNYLGLSIKQLYYSTISKRFSFSLIISYINNEQKLELLKSINSMKLGD